MAAEDPVNVKAVELLGQLHDALEDGGSEGPNLEQFLVRVLFCMFAEDTGLFDWESFTLYIDNHTLPEGADLVQFQAVSCVRGSRCSQP